ncbi:MAG: hypothetical protein ACOCP8_00625 [archaeon]
MQRKGKIKGKIVNLINHHRAGEVGKVFSETDKKCLVLKNDGTLIQVRKNQIEIL